MRCAVGALHTSIVQDNKAASMEPAFPRHRQHALAASTDVSRSEKQQARRDSEDMLLIPGVRRGKIGTA